MSNQGPNHKKELGNTLTDGIVTGDILTGSGGGGEEISSLFQLSFMSVHLHEESVGVQFRTFRRRV